MAIALTIAVGIAVDIAMAIAIARAIAVILHIYGKGGSDIGYSDSYIDVLYKKICIYM